jgi:peptidoglycan pentaglycine glycine transferase (the first glycine)
MPEVNLSEWNAFLNENAHAHLLQSGEWGELKSHFGWEAVRIVEGTSGAQILFRRLPLGLSFAYLPKGPVSTREPGNAFWGSVEKACTDRRAVFLKVEQDGWREIPPGFSIKRTGFQTSPQHIQPAGTLLISLDATEEEIFDRMKPKTRYNIRLAGRKEVLARTSADIDKFHRLLNITGHRKEFHVHSLEYYQRAYSLFHPAGKCELFFAEFQDQTLAAVMVFLQGKQAYYLYGASSDEQRNRKPTYPLQWEAIQWAHRMGCTEYDMWGIPDGIQEDAGGDDEERDDGLWGVYRFKRGFGGEIRHALPPLDRIYNPLFYKLYLWRISRSGQTENASL